MSANKVLFSDLLGSGRQVIFDNFVDNLFFAFRMLPLLVCAVLVVRLHFVEVLC